MTIDIHKIVARVSFATGWTRHYVLHSLTFKELVRYAEYARDEAEERARQQAQEIGIAIGILRRKSEPTQDTRSGVLIDYCSEDDGGVAELIRKNQRAQKWLTAL